MQARTRTGLLLVLLATAIAYGRSLANGYTYDDRQMVMAPNFVGNANAMVASDEVGIVDHFERYYGHGLTAGRGYRPITTLSYRLVHRAFAENGEMEATRLREHGRCPPIYHHAMNVALHLLATLATFFLLRPLLRSDDAALLGTAAFGLHCLRSDAVISIVGRGEILGCLGGVVATLCLAAATLTRRRGLPPAATVPAAAAFFFAAFHSKENALAWSILAPVYVWLVARHTGQRSIGRRLAITTSLTVLPAALAFGGFYLHVQRSLDVPFHIAFEANPLASMESVRRLPVALMLWGYGLFKVLWPFHLAMDYNLAVFPLDVGWSDPRVIVAIAALTLLLATGVAALRRAPILAFGVAVFFGASFVTSNVPLAIETIFAERLYYTPALLASCLVAGLTTARHWRGYRIVVIAALIWMGVAGVRCVQRCADWTSNETLFLADAEAQPRSIACLRGAATIHAERAERAAMAARAPHLAAARELLQRAASLDPDDPAILDELAGVSMLAGDPVTAEAIWRRAISKQHRRYSASMFRCYLQLGELARQRGDERETLEFYRQGVLINDQNDGPAVLTAFELALDILARQCNATDLEQLLQAAIRRFPSETTRWDMHRGNLFHLRGQHDAAIRLLRHRLPLLPITSITVRAHLHFAESLRAVGDQAGAREVLDQCLKLDGLTQSLHEALVAARRSIQQTNK